MFFLRVAPVETGADGANGRNVSRMMVRFHAQKTDTTLRGVARLSSAALRGQAIWFDGVWLVHRVCPRYRCPRRTARRSLLTESFQRPFCRRRCKTARPSLVLMRDRKPCFRRRGIRFGCQVRFGISSFPHSLRANTRCPTVQCSFLVRIAYRESLCK